MTDRELLARIAASAGQKAGYKQLVRELGLGGGRERRLLLEQLARLTARGQLVKIDREQWGIPRATSRSGSATRDNLIAGRLDLHRDGYGFVRPNRRTGAAPARQQTARRCFHSPQRNQLAPCRATRCSSKSTLPKPMAACRAASCVFWSAATPPSSAYFATRRPDRERRATSSSLSTTA